MARRGTGRTGKGEFATGHDEGHAAAMLDVVLPFYSGAALLARCLAALHHNLHPRTRVILVDDAADEDTAALAKAWCAEHAPQANMLRNAANRGFRASVERGIAAGDAPAFVLLNSDTIAPPGALAALADTLWHADAAAVAPVSNAPGDLFQFREDCARSAEARAEWLRATALRRARDWAGQVTPEPYLTAACLAIDRGRYASAGGFAKAYAHGYFEDLDLSARLRLAGHALLVREDCFVYHAGRGTYRHMETARREAMMRNNFDIFCARWGHLPAHAQLLARLEAAGRAAAGAPEVQA